MDGSMFAVINGMVAGWKMLINLMGTSFLGRWKNFD